MWRSSRTRATALLAALCLLAAACGDDAGDGADAAPGTTAPDGTGDAGGDRGDGDGDRNGDASGDGPTEGGVVTFGVFGENLGFDPVVSNGVGTNGGSELNAIYGSLMRWNPETAEAEPRLAASLEPNDDFSEWVLTLRPDVTFTDGTAFDADAVITNIERHVTHGARFSGLVQLIDDMEAVDALTVRFTLEDAWSGFPFLLTLTPGMIASPTALQACGDTPPRDCDFNTNPVGAGPFVLDSFRPQESTELARNPDYFAGAPHLDGVRFVYIPGAAPTFEALKTDTLQAAFLREASVIQQAKDEGYDGFEILNWAGEILLINNGVMVSCEDGEPAPTCEGIADGERVATTPITADRRIRQAVAAAIDPAVVDERANQGAGRPTSAIFMEDSYWYAGTDGPQYDPERARELVEEVKAEGDWDGTIRLSCDNAPNRIDTAIAVRTMLESAGFEVQVKNDYELLALIGDVINRKDFDLACWGFSIYEDEPFINLESNLGSTSSGNWIGYRNPELDAALERSLRASTDDEKRAAFDEIAQIWAEDVPSLGLGATAEYIAWSSEVHGLKMSSTTSVLFEEAWIE